MLNLPGYQILKEIHVSPKTIIYRGLRESDQKPVIIKFLKPEYSTLQDSAQFKYEYEMTKTLELEGIVKVLHLETSHNRVALIFEDFGGEALKSYQGLKKIKLKEFLLIAIQIAKILIDIHKNGILHKDIKPSNIIINPKTGQVKLTDFAIASRLERENQTINNPNLLEGTLAYMSPEQTGRMNRSIDYRSDFYSVGVTFYEMLTGQLPFETPDPMELVHCHIAKQPINPQQLNPEIPAAISGIVMKLLAKTAEERYQSALGLKVDLEICLTQLLSNGQIDNFLPGQQDKSSQFQIPQKLYGRETEVNTLLDAFTRVSLLGKSEMMLVAGYSGIGKSALVNEIHKPIVGARGYFISGKFDQYKRNIPYTSLIQAFQSLMRQLLTEGIQQLQTWKAKLLDALGQNGQIIIDVIPEVELIVGTQPTVPQLGSAESQNRFNRVFKEFIHVFTQKENPLVIFLDDLQWADLASLKLINLLISDPDSQYLLLIGAYRDNEVSATHPFMLTLEEIKKAGAIVNNIYLKSLEVADVKQLIADTVNSEMEQVEPLANLVFEKTAGNPFFLTQVLTSLYQENLLTFDFNTGCWGWDIELIQNIGITENVVELMVSKIQKLSEATQKVLRLAACIGNRFDLSVLSVVNETSFSTTATQLWEALQAGLILPLSDAYKAALVLGSESEQELSSDELVVEYKFLHDRVQQAAYALIPDSQKQEVHLKIGQLLFKNSNAEQREENIFEIVNHLNVGADLITRQSERDQLAKLNLTAGQRAKAASAYEPALRYLNMGLRLLTKDSWQHQYDLTLTLYVETVEAEYLNTNLDRAATLAEVVLQRARTLLDQVKVYELKVQFDIAQNQMIKAIKTGLHALKMLGHPVSTTLSASKRGVELLDTDIANIPVMTNPQKLAAMRLLMTIAPPSYFVKPDIFPPIILTMVNLCVEHGYSAPAVYAYGWYGALLCGWGNLDAGYRSSQLALKLLEQFNARELTCKLYLLFNISIRHWKEHARDTLVPLLEGLQSGLETGDIEAASYCAMNYCEHVFLVGETLEDAKQQQELYISLLRKLKQEFAIYYASIWRQLALNISEDVGNRYYLIGDSLNELEMLPRWQSANNHTLLFNIYLAKSILFYLFKDYTQAITNASLVGEHAEAAVGLITVGTHNFYYSLILLGQYPFVHTSEQHQYLKQVIQNQEKMQRWVEHAPANYRHKYELVEAEKARVLGQIVSAMEYYDRAIIGARQQGYIQEEALAYELAAEFYLVLGREEITQTYITKAHSTYERWGAMAKVKDLEERYPEFFSLKPSLEATTISQITRTTTSTTGNGSGLLDLTTVMKASQALTSEIVLDKLLDKLMKIVMENAGAQSCSLILVKDEQLMIEATATVEQTQELRRLPNQVLSSQQLPISVINYVKITQKNVVLNDASREDFFATDPYIKKHQPKSVLCIPIIHQGKLLGLFYLENNLTTGAFTAERLEVLRVLSSQVAISLENALLYTNLQQVTENLKQANEQLEEYSRNLEVKVEQRTLELQEKNQRLKEQATQVEKALQELGQTQAQLIQTEKLSSLGQLVAGVAHEINNPVNFIYGNLTHASEYTQDLLKLVQLFHEEYPDPTPRICAQLENIELEFLSEDLPKLLDSMKVGANRIRQIVLSLRNFSRLDEAEMKPVDIHEGIDSTLLILQNRLKGHAGRTGIEVIKEYGALPQVECYASQLNQVFMNILNNAIDALLNQQEPRKITIRTEMKSGVRDNSRLVLKRREERQEKTLSPLTQTPSAVVIRILDNGPGITELVRKRLFDPFFTTKPVGAGTGLGLSISYQIVVEKHKGQLYCISAPSHGAEFVIEIPVKQA